MSALVLRVVLIFICASVSPVLANATDVSDSYVNEMKTELGVVRVEEDKNEGYIDIVTIDGKVVLNKCCRVGLYQKLTLSDGLAINAGVNAMGSGTSFNDDYFILLKSGVEPIVLNSECFDARYRCNWKKASCVAKRMSEQQVVACRPEKSHRKKTQ